MLLSLDCSQGNATSRAIDRQKHTCSICLRAAGKKLQLYPHLNTMTLCRFIPISTSHECRQDDHTRDAQVPGIHCRVAFPSAGGFRVVSRVLVDNSLAQGETAHLSQSKIIQIIISFIRPLSGNVENLPGIRVIGRAFQSFSHVFP